MGSINYRRVVLGGIIAGVIINTLQAIFSYAVQGQWFWQAQNRSFGLYQPGVLFPRPLFAAGFALSMYLVGILSIWLYAAIRPRFGPGPRTAIMAAVAIWLVLALDDAIWVQLTRGSRRAIGEAAIAFLLIMMLSVLAGARLYKEADAGAPAKVAGA